MFSISWLFEVEGVRGGKPTSLTVITIALFNQEVKGVNRTKRYG
jgi:hypothetical protein